jgi:hypothetical protein
MQFRNRSINNEGKTMRLLLLLMLSLLFFDAAAQDSRPGRLLVFYAWPSTINGANGNVSTAAGHFSQYTHAVLGDGLQSSTHPDHQLSRNIISHPSVSQTLFFGYIPLGARSGDWNLSLTVIAQRAQQWAAMGVDGILLDEYGHDFGVTRERQNAAVASVRAQGLVVIANSWVPGDAFSNQVSSSNPNGVATLLDNRDYYMSESHQVIEGIQVDPLLWIAKEQAIAQYRSNLGFKVVSITTPSKLGTFNAQLWNYAWYSAALFDHTAVGWGELFYSVGNSLAPFRSRPTPDSQPLIGGLAVTGTRYSRRTCGQELWVDSGTATSGHTVLSPCTFVSLSGSVTGLSSGGVVGVQLNATQPLSLGNGSFTFPITLPTGTNYTVSVSTQSPGQTCSVQNGSGVVGSTNITNIQVSCQSTTFSVGGNLSGLVTGRSVGLQLNGGSTLTLNNDGVFTFPVGLAPNSGYSVTVSSQPQGQNCFVSNGAGTITGTVNNVSVQCVQLSYAVGGSVSGLLAGRSLGLRNDSNNSAVTVTSPGPFQFPTQQFGSSYAAVVGSQPLGQVCTVQNGIGTVSGIVDNIVVSCTTNSYTVGGSVVGLLAGRSVALQLNGGTPLTMNGNSDFTFASSVNSGSNYAVTVSSQPSGQTCTVTQAPERWWQTTSPTCWCSA